MQDPFGSPSAHDARADVDGAAINSLPGRLMVEITEDHGGIVVRLAGELDLETTAELDRQLAVLDETPVPHLLIDLAGVSFMDSTGLASIVRAHRAAEARGYPLVLRPGSNQVQRLFQLTGVDQRLTFEDG